MRHQPHQLAAAVFDRDVPDVPPIHQGCCEIDDIVRLHGKQVLRHELADGLVTFTPVLFLAVFRQFPL